MDVRSSAFRARGCCLPAEIARPESIPRVTASNAKLEPTTKRSNRPNSSRVTKGARIRTDTTKPNRTSVVAATWIRLSKAPLRKILPVRSWSAVSDTPTPTRYLRQDDQASSTTPCLSEIHFLMSDIALATLMSVSQSRPSLPSLLRSISPFAMPWKACSRLSASLAKIIG